MKRRDQTIIIVGAGAAGLMAAKRLASRYKIIMLEANERPGGRIHTITIPGFSRTVEAGAEFIHGKLPLTLKLLEKGHIEYTELEGNFYRVGKNGFNEQQEMIHGWDRLLKQMKREKSDMTLLAFLQKHYPGDLHHEFRRQISNYAEGFDVADPAKASMKALYNEWSHEDHEIYRIKGGYHTLIDYLVDECQKRDVDILLNSVVIRIERQPDKISVYTSDGKCYEGSKCIITVPLTFLENEIPASITFRPPLIDHIDASREIGYSTVIKLVIEFNEPFWKSFARDIGFIISDQIIPTWWTQLPDEIPLLTGWKGGPGAAELSNKSDEEIVRVGLDSLSVIFKLPVAELQQKIVASAVFNWQQQPYARGAYSYAYPTTKKAKKILIKPVDDQLYFAGEALYEEESGGTVEAALISGKEVAAKIRKTGKKKLGPG